jgi:hypothetical protein
MKKAASTGLLGCAALIFFGSVAPAGAQVVDSLVKAKALYAEASYDDALRALGTNEGPEAHQYRALCFLALGKVSEAERALEALINAAPEYSVSESDAPPRLVSMMSQTKRRIMPGIIRQLFTDGREKYQSKEMDQARGKFEKVLTLMRDPAVKDVADLKDIQVLSSGYLDIVKNTPPPAPVPSKSVTRTAVSAPVVNESFPSATPSVTPAPAAPKARPATVTPAVTLRQTVPSYSPQAGAPVQELKGTVKVVIGIDGKVKSANIEESVEPRYDIRLLAAAKSWLYKPALVSGRPIESEKLVSITVGAK